MTKNITTVTAADVRNFFREEPKRFEALAPEAQATVAEGARGRLHPQAVKVHNTRRRTRQYVLGATAEAKAKQAAARADLAAKGVAVGKRGPLSKVAKAALKQSKA